MKLLTILRISFIFPLILLLTACGSSSNDNSAVKTNAALDVYSTLTAEAKSGDSDEPNEPATDTPSSPFLQPEEPADTPTNKPPADTPTDKPPAATPNMTATVYASQAQGMKNQVQSLYADGYLKSTEGIFYSISDFSGTYAKSGGVNAYYTDYDFELTDFVLRANITWESADRNADIAYAGCGFWFGVDDEIDNFYQIMLTMNGNVRLARCLNGCTGLESIGHGKLENTNSMEGNIDVILTFEGDTITYFINGKELFSRSSQYEMEGNLFFAISSGTNTDFGMRCTFTDVELWDLNP